MLPRRLKKAGTGRWTDWPLCAVGHGVQQLSSHVPPWLEHVCICSAAAQVLAQLPRAYRGALNHFSQRVRLARVLAHSVPGRSP